MHFKRVIIKFARFESFSALNLSKQESFRGLKLSNLVSFRALTLSKLESFSSNAIQSQPWIWFSVCWLAGEDPTGSAKEQGEDHAHIYKKFINYLSFLLRGSLYQLKEFVNNLNSQDPSIHFKCVEEVPYSHVSHRADLSDNNIWIDQQGYINSIRFIKPWRVVKILFPSSSHIGHITLNIPNILD